MPVQILSVPVITRFAEAAPKKIVHPPIRRTRPPVAATQEPDTSASPPAQPALPVAEPEVQNSVESVPPAPEPPVLAQSAPTLKTLMPPSARYMLDVVRTEPNVANPYYGSGEIQWTQDGQHYALHLEVGVNILFARIRLYSVDSEGSIAEAGIKPEKMTEARRGRSATATHFNYDTNTISFSASSAILPMSPGAQDRATVLMQLAGIGNADPDQFQNGQEITIQVAEDKEAAAFQFVVLGRETIDTGLGHLASWHIVRPPRPGVYSSRLDIWICPELNWLPVQLRNTESNGAITTQTIRKIINGIPQ